MKKWLYDKTVVITGASSGFGKLLTEKLIGKYRCKVIGTGRNIEKLQNLKEKFGENFHYFSFDAGDETEWIKFSANLRKNAVFPDILINNAGVLPPFAKFQKVPQDEAERVFRTNFFAAVYSVRHVLPVIKERSDFPTVINVSSSAIFAQVIGTSIYSASKSALASFTKIIALENKEVYVALVCPGFSDTAIFRSQKQTDEKSSGLIKKFCSDPDKITDKLIKKIAKRRKRIVLGADAKAMQFFGKIFPQLTDKAISAVLKKSNLDIFSDVF